MFLCWLLKCSWLVYFWEWSCEVIVTLLGPICRFIVSSEYYKIGMPTFGTYILIVVISFLLNDFCLFALKYTFWMWVSRNLSLLLGTICLEYHFSSFCFQAICISLCIFASGVHFLLTASSWALFLRSNFLSLHWKFEIINIPRVIIEMYVLFFWNFIVFVILWLFPNYHLFVYFMTLMFLVFCSCLYFSFLCVRFL